jgi:hypothetical protein
VRIGVVSGALAGAAGTTALNAVGYLDMAWRARAASDTSEQLVKTMADRAGLDVPGDSEERGNRLAGLGPLFGSGVGVVVGMGAGVVHRALAVREKRLPAPVAVVLIAAVAMALSDVPLKVLGVSDPSQWRTKDWASDAVPHLAYGIVTYMTLRATDKP